MSPTWSESVVPFFDVQSDDTALIDLAIARISEQYGNLEEQTGLLPVETGPQNLVRKLVALDRIMSPAELPKRTLATRELEISFATEDSEEPITIDTGYVSRANVVLGGTAAMSHRVYLSEGAYAELILRYRSRGYQAVEWTPMDFRSMACHDFFENVRNRLERATLDKTNRQ
jgi:hypothetical protein